MTWSVQKFLYLTIILAVFALGLGVTADPVAGQTQSGKVINSGEVVNPSRTYLLDEDDLGKIVVRAIDWLLYLSGALAIVFLLVGGFQYIAARGNEEQSAKAKKTILGAIIGLVVVIMAYAIVYIVNTLLTRDVDENAMLAPSRQTAIDSEHRES